MTTYTQLVADVEKWAIADDQSASVPTLIALAEDRHRWGAVGPDGRRNKSRGAIRVRANERRATISGNDTRFLPLPDPYDEHRVLRLANATKRDRNFTYVEPESLLIQAEREATAYTITRTEIEFDNVIPATSSIEMVYFEPFARVTSSNPTNWLLTNVYAAYLWAAIAEMQYLLQDVDQISIAETKYDQIVSALMESEARSTVKQGRVVMQALPNPAYGAIRGRRIQ